MAIKVKALTYRVQHIPGGTTPKDLIEQYFVEEHRRYLRVRSLYPSVDSVEGGDAEGELTATVLFRPPNPCPEGPTTQDDAIGVDKDFKGFTPLYVPPTSNGAIVADIIAVTGLAGHAYGSWAHADDKMWLRDYLKRTAPNARILTYGYGSELRDSASRSTLQEYAKSFVNKLFSMREDGQCENRPIIFIGHSLGCLIIKKALVDTWFMGIHASRLPVRSIIFLAAPHNGLDITALRTLVHGQPNEGLLAELIRGSPTLKDLDDKFCDIAQGRVDITSCYETIETKTVVQNEDGSWSRTGPPVLMVHRDSAVLKWKREHEKNVPTEADHSQIAKITNGQESFYDQIKTAIRKGLRPTADIIAEDERGTDRGLWLQNTPRPTSLSPHYPGAEWNGAEWMIRGRRTSSLSLATAFSHVDSPPEPNQATFTSFESRKPGQQHITTPVSPDLKLETMTPLSETSQTTDNINIQTAPTTPGDDFETRKPDQQRITTPVSPDLKLETMTSLSETSQTTDIINIQTTPTIPVDETETDGKPEAGPKRKSGVSSDIFSGDLSVAERVVSDDPGQAHLKEVNEHGQTSLHVAAGTSHIDIMDENTWTPLQKAVMSEDIEMAKSLIEDGTSIRPPNAISALWLAVHFEKDKMLEYLVTVDGIDLEDAEQPICWYTFLLDGGPRRQYCQTILHNPPQGKECSCCTRELAQVSKSKKHLEYIKGGGVIYSSPLVYASWKGFTSTVQILLNAKANVESCTTHDRVEDIKVARAAEHPGADEFRSSVLGRVTALMCAARSGCLETSRALVAAGANVMAVDSWGWTPLMHASLLGDSAMIKHLLGEGADIHTKASLDGATVLHVAVETDDEEHVQAVKLLVGRGASLYVACDDHTCNYDWGIGDYPIHRAAAHNCTNVLRTLLDMDASLAKKKNFVQATPLHLASKVHTLRLLLEKGADINYDSPVRKGGPSGTPLFAAVGRVLFKSASPQIVHLLLEKGAKVNREKKLRFYLDENIPIIMAAKTGSVDIGQILIDHGAKIKTRTVDMIFGEVQIFAEWPIDPWKADMHPIHLAASRGFTDFVDLLLRNGADINQRNARLHGNLSFSLGFTPLQHAARYGQADTVQFLLDRGAKGDIKGLIENVLQGHHWGRRNHVGQSIDHTAVLRVLETYESSNSTAKKSRWYEAHKGRFTGKNGRTTSEGVSLTPDQSTSELVQVDKVDGRSSDGS